MADKEEQLEIELVLEGETKAQEPDVHHAASAAGAPRPTRRQPGRRGRAARAALRVTNRPRFAFTQICGRFSSA